ncbi:MAG: deoxyribonuclease IV [Acidobacteria bacterium]|nr:deoxyribonuclease IV [Acidobacteriota bacterium]
MTTNNDGNSGNNANNRGDNKNRSEGEGSPTWRVGAHTSIAGSLGHAAEHAHQIGGNSLQIFSSSPRMWRARNFPADELAAFARFRTQFNLYPLVVHCNYLINMASPDPILRERSREAFVGEIQRAEAMRANFLVLHPGSFREGSPEQGIRDVTAAIRAAVRQAPPQHTTILIENMCGQGSVLGGTFQQLGDMLALLEGLPVASCVDTAHCYGAGMDLSSEAGLNAMVDQVERTVGWENVPVLHANDSRARLGSHLDRHEHIGRGGIGSEGFRRIVNHPALRGKAFILETPIEEDGDDRRNLEMLRALRADSSSKPGGKSGGKPGAKPRTRPAVKSRSAASATSSAKASAKSKSAPRSKVRKAAK